MGSFNPEVSPPAAVAPESPVVNGAPGISSDPKGIAARWACSSPVFIGHNYTVSNVPPTSTIFSDPTLFNEEEDDDEEETEKLEISATDPPKEGDIVWSAVTGNGPFVIVGTSWHDIELANRKINQAALRSKDDSALRELLTDESFRVEAWIVKDRCGRYFTVPIHAVTKTKPFRSVALILWAWLMYVTHIRSIWNQGV